MKQFGYEESFKISYFQIDGNMVMTPAALFSDLQEVAINHSDTLGYTVDYLSGKQLGWAIINWHLQVKRMPKLGEKITIQTWSEKCRRMQAIRCFYVLDEKQEIIIKGTSRWIFMDLDKRKPQISLRRCLCAITLGKSRQYRGRSLLCPRRMRMRKQPSVRC